jgi:hypothetical protein
MSLCHACFEEEAHYHITVEQGVVTQVDYISADGYWDRELEKDEYFVEYRKDPQPSGDRRKITPRKPPPPGKPVPEYQIVPKLYKGSANFDAEAED